MKTVRIYSEDVRMEFGIGKCGMLIVEKGKLVHTEGIEFPCGEKIKEIDRDSGYKYLGILEADDTKDFEMKETLTTKYIRWIN